MLGFQPIDQLASNSGVPRDGAFRPDSNWHITDSNGEMVLYAEQRWAEYSQTRRLTNTLFPDLTPNDGTRGTNLHIIDMIVGPSDDDTANFYVDGVAVPHMQNLQMLGTSFANGAVQFGDCCGNINDTEFAIEWLKVEEGITVPHPAPEVPPSGTTGDYNGNGVVDAADYIRGATVARCRMILRPECRLETTTSGVPTSVNHPARVLGVE